MEATMQETTSANAALFEEEQKRIRKGTRSCTECRRRKIRCIFSSAEHICDHCSARGLTCIPQLYRVKQKSHRETSSQDRIAKLEQQVASLAAAVSSPGQGAPIEDESSSDIDAECAAASPPTHLRLLFDNAAVAEESVARKIETNRLVLARLQALVPSKGDVARIAGSAAAWMLLYRTFFPASTLVGSPGDLLSGYDALMSDEADPIRVGGLLLSLAITVLQLGISQTDLGLQSIEHPKTFVKRVMKVVKSSTLFNDDLGATYDGIELHLFYVRLLLALGDIRDMFLMLRRTIGLAEYLGMHKIPINSSSRPVDDRRYTVLKVMCATDRLGGMMFNLPVGTANYKLPQEDILEADGSVSVHVYMMELAKIAVRVQDIDEDLALGKPYHEVYEKVLSCDGQLRILACKTPPKWWEEVYSATFDPKYLAQSFHWYLTVRIHLHSAMRGDSHDQYAYSRGVCLEACRKSATRILFLREALPRGFFMLRLLQMQIFTVAIVLLLSTKQYETSISFDERMQIVSSIVNALDADIRDKQGNVVFAGEAAAALRALQQWLNTPDSLATESLTLRVPMLGKVLLGQGHRQTIQTPNGGLQPMQDDLWTQPWSLELDVNAMYDEAFMTTGLGDLEQYWPDHPS